MAPLHPSGDQLHNHDGPLQNNDGTIPRPAARRSKPDWGCTRSAAVHRRSPACRPSSPWPTPFFSPASPASRWLPGNRRPRPPRMTSCSFAAVAYLDLLRAFQQQAIAQETLDHAEQFAELTAAFARSRTRHQADADRAQTELAVRQNRRGPGRRAGPGCLGPAGGTAPFAARPHPGAGGTDHRADRAGFARCGRGATRCRRPVAPPGVGREPPPRRGSGGATGPRAIRTAVAQRAPGCKPERISAAGRVRRWRTSPDGSTSTPPPIGNSATSA